MAKTDEIGPGETAREPSEPLSYEAALAQMEQIIASLETGELALEDALARYEEGAALAAYCEGLLNEAELRVRKWQPDSSASSDFEGEAVEFGEW